MSAIDETTEDRAAAAREAETRLLLELIEEERNEAFAQRMEAEKLALALRREMQLMNARHERSRSDNQRTITALQSTVTELQCKLTDVEGDRDHLVKRWTQAGASDLKNSPTGFIVEEVAKLVHEAMVKGSQRGANPRGWQGGNSDMEDYARGQARQIIQWLRSQLAPTRSGWVHVGQGPNDA